MPDETKAVEKSLTDVKRKIDRLLDQVESGGKVDEVQERLAQRRRRERDQLQRQLDSLQARQPKLQAEPTRAWVEQQLQSLANLLASSQPAAAYAMRDLVGGKIVVEQVIVPGRIRHYLRAKLQLQLSSIVPKLDSAFITDSPQGEEIELDLREVVVDDRIERAKAMYDRGMLGKEIAKELGCRPAKVTQLLHKWSELHGVPLPDGRKRVHGVKHGRGERPMHQRIAQRVMELEATGLLLDEIAQQLDCDRNMVTQAYQWWHQQRGLPIPDGRTRRRQLPRKTSRDRDAGSAPAA